jgi:hypothetical protein
MDSSKNLTRPSHCCAGLRQTRIESKFQTPSASTETFSPYLANVPSQITWSAAFWPLHGGLIRRMKTTSTDFNTKSEQLTFCPPGNKWEEFYRCAVNDEEQKHSEIVEAVKSEHNAIKRMVTRSSTSLLHDADNIPDIVAAMNRRIVAQDSMIYAKDRIINCLKARIMHDHSTRTGVVYTDAELERHGATPMFRHGGSEGDKGQAQTSRTSGHNRMPTSISLNPRPPP